MKKIIVMAIIVGLLVLFFIGYSHFVGFEELTKTTWASFSILSILNGLGIFVFIIFGILALLKKYIIPKFFYRYLTDKKQHLDLSYIICFCVTLTLIIKLIIMPGLSYSSFFWHYSIIAFIYLFGIASVCINMFKL
jgi:uncharacterized membrane-anchored protein